MEAFRGTKVFNNKQLGMRPLATKQATVILPPKIRTATIFPMRDLHRTLLATDRRSTDDAVDFFQQAVADGERDEGTRKSTDGAADAAAVGPRCSDWRLHNFYRRRQRHCRSQVGCRALVPKLGVNYLNWVMRPFDLGNGLFLY